MEVTEVHEAVSRPPIPIRAESFAPPVDDLKGLGTKGLIVGLVGAALLAVGYFTNHEQFFRSYLIGYLLWLSVACGSLALLVLHHMSRGAWGLVIRRIFEASVKTLPFLLVLAIPIYLGMNELYSWSRPGALDDPILKKKAWYLTTNFFWLRMGVYFGLFMLMGFRLTVLSKKQDETADPKLFHRMQRIAAPGILLYAMLASFMGIDFLMTLDPHWFSSIYGLYFIISQALAALAFTVLVVFWLGKRAPMDRIVEPRHLHDYGKLLLAFVMVWAYFSFSQFLIIWSGNLPEEVTFFLNRLQGGWQYVSLAVIMLHFVLPFLLLLSRDLKRSAHTLAPIAAWLLAMRWLDFYWQAAPAFTSAAAEHGGGHGGAFHPSWQDLVAPIAIGGLWLFVFTRNLQARPLLPVNDPYLPEALNHE
jgi:hypothetical protein